MPSKFYEQNCKAGLKSKRRLSAFIDGLITEYLKEVKKVDLSYVFCDDGFLLEMNQKFLSHDTLTDIITFDLSERKDTVVAEIYISVERVKENAGKFNVPYLDELHRVIFHGALHLCGFKDKNTNDRKLMRNREDHWLALYKKEIQGTGAL